MAMLTQGTEIYFLDPETDTVTKVGCPTNIGGLGGARTQIPTTCLDSDEAESLPGQAQPAPVTIQVNFDPTDPSHARLFDLFQDPAQPLTWWALGLSDGAGTPPTSGDSTGFVLPTSRSWFEFQAYVADAPIEVPLGGVYTSAISIQRSGPAAFTAKTT